MTALAGPIARLVDSCLRRGDGSGRRKEGGVVGGGGGGGERARACASRCTRSPPPPRVAWARAPSPGTSPRRSSPRRRATRSSAGTGPALRARHPPPPPPLLAARPRRGRPTVRNGRRARAARGAPRARRRWRSTSRPAGSSTGAAASRGRLRGGDGVDASRRARLPRGGAHRRGRRAQAERSHPRGRRRRGGCVRRGGRGDGAAVVPGVSGGFDAGAAGGSRGRLRRVARVCAGAEAVPTDQPRARVRAVPAREDVRPGAARVAGRAMMCLEAVVHPAAPPLHPR